MKSPRILFLPLLAVFAGCATTPEQPKSSSRPAVPQSADVAQLRDVYVPVMGSGGSAGLQQFRR